MLVTAGLRGETRPNISSKHQHPRICGWCSTFSRCTDCAGRCESQVPRPECSDPGHLDGNYKYCEVTRETENKDVKYVHMDGLNLRNALAEPPANLQRNDVAFVFARGRLLSTLMDALSRRFTDNPGILASCSAFYLLLFQSTEADAEDYGDDKVDKLVDYFLPALECQDRDRHNCQGMDGLEGAHTEEVVTNPSQHWFADPRGATLEEINRKLGQICPNVLKLVDLIMTLPASSADAERGFSHLKHVKTDRRCRLLDRHLSDQLTIMLESATVKDYDPMPAIYLWIAEPRRLRTMQNKELSDMNLKQTSPIIDIDHDDNVVAVSESSDSVGEADHHVGSQMSSPSLNINTVDLSEHDPQPDYVDVVDNQNIGDYDCNHQDSDCATVCDKGIQVSAVACDKYVHVSDCSKMCYSSKKMIDKSVQAELIYVTHSLASREMYERDEDYEFENESLDECDSKIGSLGKGELCC